MRRKFIKYPVKCSTEPSDAMHKNAVDWLRSWAIQNASWGGELLVDNTNYIGGVSEDLSLVLYPIADYLELFDDYILTNDFEAACDLAAADCSEHHELGLDEYGELLPSTRMWLETFR